MQADTLISFLCDLSCCIFSLQFLACFNIYTTGLAYLFLSYKKKKEPQAKIHSHKQFNSVKKKK